MQFIDLSKQHAVIHEKIEVRIKNVLDKNSGLKVVDKNDQSR